MAGTTKVFYLAEGDKTKASAALSWCATNSSHNGEMSSSGMMVQYWKGMLKELILSQSHIMTG